MDHAEGGERKSQGWFQLAGPQPRVVFKEVVLEPGPGVVLLAPSSAATAAHGCVFLRCGARVRAPCAEDCFF